MAAKTNTKTHKGRSEPTTTLPARYYHDSGIYETEREGVFFSQWLLFGHESALPEPGNRLAQSIAGRPVFVIRDNNGELKGFHNVCRHRAARLFSDGIGRSQVLRCPYHGWVYDMSGTLKKAPDFGDDDSKPCENLALYPVHVRVWNHLVFICMATDPPSFEEALGDLPDLVKDMNFGEYEFHQIAEHELACNWKTYAENYLEGYHIPDVHPGLNKEVDMASYRVIPGRKIAQHISEAKIDDPVNDGLWVWLWPHGALNIYADGMNLELMIPTGPQSMTLSYCYLFKPEAKSRQKTISMSEEVTQEDIQICEIVQENLAAGIYDTGILSPKHEQGVAYFQSLVRAAHK